MTPLEVAAMLKKKLADYPKGSSIEVTTWHGPDMWDLFPPHAKEQRLMVEFRIREVPWRLETGDEAAVRMRRRLARKKK